ncbi:MAG: ABC transporter substrate-binding protein [Rhodobacteraceae bacterium]|nr:ABC transporter substrate-binding protein [Paracoccaceae bacterium]
MRLVVLLGMFLSAVSTARAEISISIHYLKYEAPAPPTLSNLDPTPEDEGIAGAQVGLADNLTTGKFLGHGYDLTVTTVPQDGDLAAAARAALSETPYLLVDAPADKLLALADLPEAQGALIFNVSAEDIGLRSADCRANLLHTAPSHAMRSDALAQFLLFKRWGDLALIVGPHAKDRAFAAALHRSAAKFQLRIRGEKTWAFDADMRRNAAQEVPLFVQDLPKHDILLVADEIGDFGRYVLFNTWEPRPIAGSEGMTPVAWSPAVEQWGAAQLQSRFEEASARPMRPADYSAWAAIRTLGEAVTRTSRADVGVLRDYILSDAFELAGFKGRPLSFRHWNGQMRQPIPIVHPRAVVATAPLEGFLHQRNELDTLGLDAPESSCSAFGDRK